MKKRTSYYITVLLLGLCCIGASFFFKTDDVKAIGGILIGTGIGMSGLSLISLYMMRVDQRNPEMAKQNAIEFRDERNTMIRDRARAKAGDITQWLIMAIAYITILINAPLWATLAVVAVFLTYNILGLYLMSKYQKEM